MTCTACELRRARLLAKSLRSVDAFALDEFMAQLEYRWPNRFYVEHGCCHWRVLQRNTVYPYQPAEVCDGFYS